MFIDLLKVDHAKVSPCRRNERMAGLIIRVACVCVFNCLIPISTHLALSEATLLFLALLRLRLAFRSAVYECRAKRECVRVQCCHPCLQHCFCSHFN